MSRIALVLALVSAGCAVKSALPSAQAAASVVGTDALDVFDGKTLSYARTFSYGPWSRNDAAMCWPDSWRGTSKRCRFDILR